MTLLLLGSGLAHAGELPETDWLDLMPLSARQFHNKGMPDLDGPLILKEVEWVQKYSNATTRKLIKYKDFDAPDSATNTFRSLPGLFSPGDVIDDGILLYWPQAQQPDRHNHQ